VKREREKEKHTEKHKEEKKERKKRKKDLMCTPFMVRKKDREKKMKFQS